jgi:L-aminopeptidase/D-esterase-like protein
MSASLARSGGGDIVRLVELAVDCGVRGYTDRWMPGRRRNMRPPATSTTLTVLVTNVRLDRRELTQLGRQVHASMARAIDPIHALDDGDVLFSVTTGEVDDGRSLAELGVVASELAWDAVLSAVADPAALAG